MEYNKMDEALMRLVMNKDKKTTSYFEMELNFINYDKYNWLEIPCYGDIMIDIEIKTVDDINKIRKIEIELSQSITYDNINKNYFKIPMGVSFIYHNIYRYIRVWCTHPGNIIAKCKCIYSTETKEYEKRKINQYSNEESFKMCEEIRGKYIKEHHVVN